MINSEKRLFVVRVFPAIIAAAVWLLVDVLLNQVIGGPFASHSYGSYRTLANILAGARFGLVFLGALFIYPAMFVLGAKPAERIVGSYSIVLAYTLTAMVRSTAFFSVGKAIFYGFNQMASSNLVFQICLMCLAEMACRWWYRRRYNEPVRIVRWGHVLGIVIGAAGLYVGLFWEGGVHWFYVYQELYKLLFL